MKWLLISIVLLAVLAGLAGAPSAIQYWKQRTAPSFEFAAVSRGGITSEVRATGTVEPVLTVQVGSFVSGMIESLHADFNDVVKKGQVLAKIDPRLLEADVARDQAALATAKAEVQRVQALLDEAKSEEGRGLALRADNPGYISDAELDRMKFRRISLEAQLAVAETGVQQAEARLNNSQANLQYTEIRSPVDGQIIDRRVEPGQTVAATFATPILFVVVPDLAGEMHVFAKVDEADIGLVREAQEAGRPVHFTVDAYPEEQFVGKIKQIRSRSSTIESVVTFPVVVTTTNAKRKLLPGMTGNLLFTTAVKENALRVPNAAIRFYPPAQQVRLQDRKLLDPNAGVKDAEAAEAGGDEAKLTTAQLRNRRHVWVTEGRWLKAIEVTIGISDDQYTEIVSKNLSEGDRVAVGLESKGTP
jgi:HlyD family secretion protein